MKEYIHRILILAMACTAALLTGCEQSNEVSFTDDNNAPVVKGIADAVANEAVDSITIGQMIKVGGLHFGNVEKVKLNDIEIAWSKITRLRDGLYFLVPRIPRSTTNTLILESKYGIYTYPVHIKFPPFSITGILNEYTPKGKEITLTGESMDLYANSSSKLIFSNTEEGISVETTLSSISQNEIRAIVPLNAPDKATVTFYSADAGFRTCPVKYRDSEFVIENLEAGGPATRYPEWVVPNVSYPEPLAIEPTEGVRYSHIYKISATAGSTLNFVGNYNITIPDKYYTNAEEYELKFEMLTVEPISYRIAVSVNWGTTWVQLGPSTLTNDSTLWFSTGKQWKTVSFPMATWKNKTGEKKLRVWNTLPANVLYDVCFDNFRIQKKSN